MVLNEYVRKYDNSLRRLKHIVIFFKETRTKLNISDIKALLHTEENAGVDDQGESCLHETPSCLILSLYIQRTLNLNPA